MRKTFLIILLSLFILAIPTETVIAADDSESIFEGDGFETHCTIGAIGIALVLFVIVSGFLVSERFGQIQNKLPLIQIHKISTVIMPLFFTGLSIYGFTLLGWFLIPNIHGYIGLLIPIAAWLNVLVSPCVAKKIIKQKNASRIHAIFAIILLLLVIFQVVYANILES